MSEARWARILATTHEMHAVATVLDYRGEEIVKSNGDAFPMLPVESLRWNLDATSRPSMTADLTVPLMDSVHDVWWGPETSNAALTPYGNMLELNLEIIGYDEIDHCRLGFVLIDTVTVNRPNNTINLHCVDLTDVLINRKMKGPKPNKAQSDDPKMTDWAWFNKLLDDAGFRQWKRTKDGSIDPAHEQKLRRLDPHHRISRTHKITKVDKWTAGTTYMDALDDLAGRGATPSYIFLDRNCTLRVHRPALLEIDVAPSGAAHVISGGPGGTLSEVTSVLTRSGAINSLTVRNDHPVEYAKNIAKNFYIDGGPMRRSRVSLRTEVEETTREWSADQVKAYTEEKLLSSGGARRRATVRGMINPYIEPGSAVQFVLDGQKETFTARSISISIPGGLMTVDAQGWIDERSNVKEGFAPPMPQDPPPPEPEKGKYPDAHRFSAVEKRLDNGPGTEKSVKNTAAALRAVAAKFPEIDTVSGYRTDSYRYHPHGLALDIMMPPWNDAPGEPDLGNKIVRWFIDRQKTYGVDYIMWNHRIWNASYGNLEFGKSRRVADRGTPTKNHMDHIHLNLHPFADYPGRVDEIRKGTYWRSPSEEYDEDFIKPMSSMLYTTGYWYGHPAGHNAVDYNTHGDGALRVISDGGKVTVKETSKNGNNLVKLAYELPGGTLTTVYYHMRSPATRPQGTKNLKKGFVIGHMGATGNASGDHLHLETWFEGSHYNPLEVFKALRAPFGGPSHGADLSYDRMKALRKKFFGDPNWKGVNAVEVYGLGRAGPS